jgi:hypothetical protein
MFSDVLASKIQALQQKNLPLEKGKNAELITMLQWYNCPEDSAMPSKKKWKACQILWDLWLRGSAGTYNWTYTSSATEKNCNMQSGNDKESSEVSAEQLLLEVWVL